MKEKKKRYMMFFVLAGVFVVLNSFGIIFYSNNGDTALFNTIGRFWGEGKVPYIDLFDHKGPLIFFINMISWKLFQCEQGTLFFQIIFLFFTIIFLYKIAKIEIESDKKCFIFTILTLCFLVFTYSGGNLTEEYCLPFITCSMYFVLKFLNNYLKNEITGHPYKYAFVYGISVAVCFLTRLTNAVSICVGILMIGIVLLKEKNFKNIFENSIAFVFGFLVLFVPFAIYFAKNNVFYEFMEGTILFNFKYATNSASWLKNEFSLRKLITYLIYFFPSYIIIMFAILKIKRQKNIVGIFYILLGIFETILFISNRLFAHYAVICLPNILISLIELEKCKIHEKYRIIVYILMIISCLTVFIKFQLKNEVSDYSIYDNFMEQIPEEEKDSFIAVDLEKFRRIYNHYNICPYYKYFVLQDFHASNSEELYHKIYDEFNNGNVKWILFGGYIEKTLIKDILEERYVMMDKRDNIRLYKLKN